MRKPGVAIAALAVFGATALAAEELPPSARSLSPAERPACAEEIRVLQNRRKILIFNEDLHVFTHHGLEFPVRCNVLGGDRGNALEEKFQSAVEDQQQNFLFGGDMMIQTRLLNVYRRCNVRHGCAMKPFLAEDLGCSIKNIVSGHMAPSLPNGR